MKRTDPVVAEESDGTSTVLDRLRIIVAFIIRLPSYYMALLLTLLVLSGIEHHAFSFAPPLVENLLLPVATLTWSLLAVIPFRLIHRAKHRLWFLAALLCAGLSTLWGMVAPIRFESSGKEGTIERVSQEHREKGMPPLGEYREYQMGEETAIYRPFRFEKEHWILLPILLAPFVAFLIAPRRPAFTFRSVT